MSTIEHLRPATPLPLVAGERLDRLTFHERYEAMPPSTRAELIGGVVHMPSPLSRDHGDENVPVVGWLFHYQRFTPGVQGTINASTFLDDQSETQPDVSLRILPEAGGQTRDEGDYLAGAPELVVEIARSSRSIDLGPKKDDYERAGVLEYLVVALNPVDVFWYGRRGGRFERIPPGADGCYHSEVFPGLWLDPEALLNGDLDGLIAALERGLATAEHAAFVARLARARRGGD
jgi:Uma2 family endonuclease